MCCWTHEHRDIMDKAEGRPFTLVPLDHPERCQCPHVTPCQRQMNSETLQCDWCWFNKHGSDEVVDHHPVRHDICEAIDRKWDALAEAQILPQSPYIYSTTVPYYGIGSRSQGLWIDEIDWDKAQIKKDQDNGNRIVISDEWRAPE